MDKLRHDPACKQEVLNMAQQKHIHVTKRSGKIAGTAIAAALLAANVGGGYLLLHGRNQALNPPAATEIESEIELSAATEEAAALPCYVDRMQEYYTALTGEPCDFDFTGFGRDFEGVSAEDEDWRVELKAVTGCDWVLYYFYDVTPLKGQTTDEFQREFPGITFLPCEDGNPTGAQSTYGFLHGQSNEPDNGVWHCSGIIYNMSTVPFSAENNKLRYQYNRLDIEEPDRFYELEYTPQSVPLNACSSDFQLSYDVNRMCSAPECNATAYEKDLGEIPMRHAAVSPFGLFLVSDSFETDTASGWKQTLYTLNQLGTQLGFEDNFVQVNADEAVEGYYHANKDTYFGTRDVKGNAIAFIHILFDHPIDAAKGTLRLQDEPVTVPENAETPETEPAAEQSENDFIAVPRKAPADVPCVVYGARDSQTGEPVDAIADYYPDTTAEARAEFEQVAVYSRYVKLLVNGKELKGIGEEISPDENNMLNVTFAWTPDESVKNQNISIDILPDPVFADPLVYGKSEGENIVSIEPYQFKDYVDPETNEVIPPSLPDAIAAFTPDPTAENCVPMRYSIQIDMSQVNLTESPRGKQLTFLIDYHAADTSGSKKDVIFCQEFILMVK